MGWATMSEESLIKSAMAGDQVAFAGVVEIYQRPVYNLCYRMLGNSGEAEDAAQEAFLARLRAAGTL